MYIYMHIIYIYIYIYIYIHKYIYIFTKIKVTTMVVTCCSGTTPFSTAPVGQQCQGAKTGAAAADTFGPNRFHGVLAAQWDGLSGSRSSKILKDEASCESIIIFLSIHPSIHLLYISLHLYLYTVCILCIKQVPAELPLGLLLAVGPPGGKPGKPWLGSPIQDHSGSWWIFHCNVWYA